MALTLKGEQTIGTKFAADVSRLRLIGVRIDFESYTFLGVYNRVSDLPAASTITNNTTIAFVRLNDIGGYPEEATFVTSLVPQSGGVRQWFPIGNGLTENTVHIDNYRVQIGADTINEVGEESGLQTDINLDPATLSFTQPTQVGEHLTLANNYHFAIDVNEANNEIFIIQGLKFSNETGNPAPNDEAPYYYWGLGTDSWAFFTEDGEYVVTNWTLEV
jgi:hypothetical protein